MADGTRERIMEIARRMFGDRGYNAVSLRSIADELGMSIGNLTYHFARKEDLVQAVALAQHAGYRPMQTVDTFIDLHSYLVQLLHHHDDNAYYFRHYTQLAQILPEIYKMQVDVMHDFVQTLQDTFAALGEQGMMHAEELPGQYRHLAQTIRMLTLYGEGSIEDRLAAIWALLYPLLTEKGKQDWQETIALELVP